MRRLTPAPSFEDVYREHFGFVWSTLLRLGVPRPGIEDAVQDVFVVVHRRLPDFEGRGAGLRSWLFTIVRRVAYRQRRGVQRADRKHRALAQVRTRPMEMDEALDQRTAANLLLEALDELDHDKRVALDLHVFEGLSGPQIAQMLEINVDTAYSRIKAARRRLQRSLEARGLSGDPTSLYEAARRRTRPPRGARRKVAAALGLWPKSAPATVTGIGGLKAALLGVALGGVAVAVGVRTEPPDRVASEAPLRSGVEAAGVAPPEGSATPVAPAAPEPATPRPVAEIEPAPSAEAPDHTPRTERSRGAARSPESPEPTATAAAQLAAEVELLTQAKRALARDPGRTLRLLATHAERFPHGQLGTERAGYRAIALCQLGRSVQGRGEARLFVSAHGRSSLASRVATACEISLPTP